LLGDIFLRNRAASEDIEKYQAGTEIAAMLDAFIIEEIKRREEKREDRSRHQPQAPTPTNDEQEGPGRRSETEDDGPQRGVIIIDLSVIPEPAVP
jgi:hypothetical protein